MCQVPSLSAVKTRAAALENTNPLMEGRECRGGGGDGPAA